MSHKENKVYIKYANIKFIFIHIYKEKEVDISRARQLYLFMTPPPHLS